MVAVLGLAAGVAVDIVVALILLPHMPDDWDLTGNYFTLTVPLAQFIVLVPALMLGAMFGVFRWPRLVLFWLLGVGVSVGMLVALNNPVGDIMRYQVSFTLWVMLAAALVWWLGRGGRRQ